MIFQRDSASETPCARIHIDVLKYAPRRLVRRAKKSNWPLADMFEMIDQHYRLNPRLFAKAHRASDIGHFSPRPQGLRRIEEDTACGEEYPRAVSLWIDRGRVEKQIWLSIWAEMRQDGQLSAMRGETAPATKDWIDAVSTIGEYRRHDPRFKKPLCGPREPHLYDSHWLDDMVGHLDGRVLERGRKYDWPMPLLFGAIEKAYQQRPKAVQKARQIVAHEQDPTTGAQYKLELDRAWQEVWSQLRDTDALCKDRRPSPPGRWPTWGQLSGRDWRSLAAAVGRRMSIARFADDTTRRTATQSREEELQ